MTARAWHIYDQDLTVYDENVSVSFATVFKLSLLMFL